MIGFNFLWRRTKCGVKAGGSVGEIWGSGRMSWERPGLCGTLGVLGDGPG